MRILISTVITLISVLLCHCRLIQRNANKTIEADVSLPTRITRAAQNEDLTSFSKEDYQSSELAQPTTRRLQMSFKQKNQSRQKPKSSRVPREYSESNNDPNSNKTDIDRQQKTKAPLIKKPIPKFNELDYEEDFQVKVIRSPVAFADSGDHEDDDFNLDDYDFDVNHDEYSGRGKPLEPRVKNKNLLEQQNLDQSESEPEHTIKPIPLPVIKIKSRVPVGDKLIKKRDHKHSKKAAHKLKEDYYDDVTSLTKAPVPEQENKAGIEDEQADDNEESKEFERKSARMVRSPWIPNTNTYVDKLGEKTSVILSKIMSALPMFPQVPRQLEESYADWYRANYNNEPIMVMDNNHLY